MVAKEKVRVSRGFALVVSVLAGTAAANAEELQEDIQWTGFYAGAHAGAALADYDFDSRFGEVENGAFHSGLAAGGVQIGYDWQKARIVLGLEGRFTVLENEETGAAAVSLSEVTSGAIGGGIGGAVGGAGMGTSPVLPGGVSGPIRPPLHTACTNCMAPAASTTVSAARVEGFSTKAEWSAAATGRIGLAYGRFLPFISGGLALGRVEDHYVAAVVESVNGGPGVAQSAEIVNDAGVQVGYTIGAGLEYAATRHVSLRGEYGYTDLGERRYSFEGSDNQARFETNLQEVRLGANYRF